MHYSHFAKRGFRVIREEGGGKLMYLPLSQAELEVGSLAENIPVEGRTPVEVLVIGSLFCSAAATVLYLRKVAAEFGDRVSMVELPAGPEALARYGVADGIFINGKPAFFGPATEEQVRTKIREELASGGG